MHGKSIASYARATLALLMLLGVAAISTGAPTGATAQGEKPNMVFILTDDMRVDDLSHMPKTRKLLAEQGTTFENAFVTYSLCCPARATFLRGQYAHNHDVRTNAASAHGSEVWFRKLGRDRSTVATWLQDTGYSTGFVGKYMNAYDDEYVPPGWDDWRALSGKYHKDLKLNENGEIKDYDVPSIDDLLAKKATGFLNSSASGDPFYLQVSTHAPHAPNDFPPRYADKFSNAKAPRPPSFREEDVRDKPGYIQEKGRIGSKGVANIDRQYRDRLRQLLSVDDMVGEITKTLRGKGELDNTYIVFTSDNGFHFGEHRIKVGKWTPYEEAIRVPTVVRGPGVPHATRPEMVINNDFAPTFADLGGASTPQFVDGSSFAPLLRGESPDWRKRFLVESWHANLPSSPPNYQAVRTENMIWTEYRRGGDVIDRELYGLKNDPYELTSRHGTKNRDLVRRLDGQLADLSRCKADECRRAEGF